MSKPLSRRDFIQSGALALGALAVSGCTGLGSKLASPRDEAQVFFTPEITPDGLLKVYSRINRNIGGKVAIKVHTGEPNGPNILPRDMVKALQQRIPDSALVETNTLYKGKRFTTADHRETIRTTAGTSARSTSWTRTARCCCRSGGGGASPRCRSAKTCSTTTRWWSSPISRGTPWGASAGR